MIRCVGEANMWCHSSQVETTGIEMGAPDREPQECIRNILYQECKDPGTLHRGRIASLTDSH